MADNITLTIDGKMVEVPPGTLIVEAAQRLGITIPTFCYDERLRSVGACRMCLVEVEKMPKLVASCATPVAPSMVVHTKNDRVIKAREGVLEFLLINHPLDCPTCDKGGECPLQDLTYAHGPAVSRYRENKIRFIEDINQKFDDKPLGPEIILNRNRCIMCYKCVRIVRDLAGEADLGVFKRGAFTNISNLNEVAYADEFSGNTVEYCPVGALLSRSYRYSIREWLLKKATSVCNLCPVGCNMNVEWSAGRVYRHMSRRNREVDDGWLCDRGRYGFDIFSAADRLFKPHIRRGSTLEPCGFDEALIVVSKHLRKIIDQNLGMQVAAVGSPTLSNEEAYAIRHFFDDVIKTPEIDFQTDMAHPVESGIIDLVGLDGAIRDLERDTVFVIVGADPAVEQPVATLLIKKAVSIRNARAIFIGSYDKRLGHFPITNIRIPYGAEGHALEHISNRLENKAASDDIRLNEEALNEIEELARKGERVHIIAGRNFFNHPDRAGFLAAMLRLRKLANARLSILPPQSNFIGVSHFGLFGDVDHSFNKILERIDSGEIKTLFVFGSNPVDEFPDRKFVLDTLKKLEFLVVVAPFMHPTASLAGAVFPQAMLPDYGGTFTNIEGRIQLFEPMSDRPHVAVRPAWGILGEIADLINLGRIWYHDREIRDEIARQLKGMAVLAHMPSDGFLFPFRSQEELETRPVNLKTLPARKNEHSYILQFAQSVHHQGWLTEKSNNLMRISGREAILIHPEDAARDGIVENQAVTVSNSDESITVTARITTHVNRGEALLVNSFTGQPANKLMSRDSSITYVSVKGI
ncbi:MAG: NADH dehydrogenase (quinone) subunit G [candidate division Zixibacteria bacterium RBG_16_53_22]|nr:MAG: NADH dehydrogenase (quinone) subunit G [candidate division Zixibacteria bacterium RBG_16_53_22]